ncbi:hypothetical protein QYF36_005266 [Acer negundo]|nr:hypothetical protein QYF36_005266 [Acer negundo]
MKKAELIFIPLPGTSHLLPILELTKRLTDRDDRISITVLLIKLPFGGGDHGINTKSLTANSQSRIRFIDVPEADPPPMQLLMTSPETYFSVFTEKNTPHVRKIVEDIVSDSDSNEDSVRVTGLVIDIGFLGMIDVAIELALPCYIFLASNIGILSLMLYLSTRHADDDRIGTVEFQSFLDSELVTLHGFVNPVPVSVMPSGFFNKDSYTIYVQEAHRLKNANGIIVNTFSELESYALNSFSSGGSNPPVYTVGPLLDLQVHQANLQDNSDRSQRILKWLDDQPDSSVLFLCFGMGGRFGPEQVKEIASGLEKSEYRFLWTLRVLDSHQSTDTDDDHDPDLFPGGFLERMEGRGMICRWAPQVKVLQHKAIGGFVSHCGWNSILESLCCGVPIMSWPLYAEQKFNAFMMVKELGLAAAIESGSGKDNGGLVAAEEVARALRHVMDGDNEIRKKAMEMAEISKKSLMEGGSSFVSLGKFIDLNF